MLILTILLYYAKTIPMKHIAILISGSGTNMQSLIKKSKTEELPVDFIIITDNPKAIGINKAKDMNIPVFILPDMKPGWRMSENDDKNLMNVLIENNTDYILLAGYMRILNKDIIEQYIFRIINIHPSLLPAFQGKDAQKQAFDYGAKISGCTVHFVDNGVDTGPILEQKAVDISKCNSRDEVQERIIIEEHKLYFEVFKNLINRKYSIKSRNVIKND